MSHNLYVSLYVLKFGKREDKKLKRQDVWKKNTVSCKLILGRSVKRDLSVSFGSPLLVHVN